VELSVVIPVYNAAKTVAWQLESLARQYWSRPWEVIVAENGSVDQSLSICQQYRDRIANLRIVDATARRGAAYARNVGASAAKARALAFCDADDKVASGWVAAMGEALTEHNFVAGRIDCKALNEPWLWDTRPVMPGHKEYFDRRLAVVPSCNLGIKRDLHDAVGGFDISIPLGTFCEDDDYSAKVHLLGERPHFVLDALVHYRYRKNLRGIFKQAVGYGKGDTFMYERYAHINYWKPDKIKSTTILKDIVLKTRTKTDLGRRLWEIGNKIGQSTFISVRIGQTTPRTLSIGF
jgi:glycosyltransferase involved in cell wall biosynthesis